MIGLGAPYHKSTNHLAEADIHLLLDKYDAMKVIWHQLAGDQLDISATFFANAERLLRCSLFMKCGYIIPAAQNGSTQVRGADMCLCGSITA
jgi:hypothetical protein